MSDSYSFTTTQQDDYLKRVVEEASSETDFIFVTERSTLPEFVNLGSGALVLVRKLALTAALFIPTATLAGRPLEEFLIDAIEESGDNPDSSDWLAIEIEGEQDAVNDELESIRNEVQRIKNVNEGRVVRVAIESF